MTAALVTDSLNLDKPNGSSASPSNPFADEFDELWKIYPKRSGSNPKKPALQAYSARRKEGTRPEDIRSGLLRYIDWLKATDKLGTEIVMQAKRFFGPGTEWENPFELPEGKIYLPFDNQELWEIRGKLGMDPFFEDMKACHEEMKTHIREHPECRASIQPYLDHAKRQVAGAH